MGSYIYAYNGIPYQERLTGWSFEPWSITNIPLITRGNIKVGGSSPSLLTAQLPLQMVNLQLYSFGALLLRDMTRVASSSMRGMHTSLLIPSALKIEEMILMLGSRGFLLVRTRSYHN